GENLSFKDSDLYYSTFISSNLKNVSFVECNLKKTDLYNSERTNVNFKYSNYEEALFNRNR
ncbi:MAG: pentapeptide repeat-containing protein, partial [Spirochaetaceae bacterium]|nr:pentapeptide repeat-containing protein [Spirochaetaceae bacterium]